MHKYKLSSTIITLAFTLVIMFSFASCGDKDSDIKDSNNSENNTQATRITETNAEGKTPDELNSEDNNFYGRWVATSETAEYLYGNLEITINEGGTFDANVTDELFSGTWEKVDDGITFDSEYISGRMYFGDKCRMVIYEEDIAPITLTKQ